MKKLTSIALALLFMAALFAAPACKKPQQGEENTEFPNEKQTANIIAIAEAFYEYGEEYGPEHALSFSELEKFVWYLYNGELTADASGFGSVPADEADARLRSFFGLSPVLRTYQRQDAEQNYYYKNDRYYIRVSGPSYERGGITSAVKNEDGTYSVRVSLFSDKGFETVLDFIFNVEGDDTRVVSVTRFEGA